MNLILLTLFSACTPWKDHRDIATVETPVEASLVQSEFRFFTIEGNKLLAFPVLGCSAKVEMIKDVHTFQVDYIKGSGGMWQSVQVLERANSYRVPMENWQSTSIQDGKSFKVHHKDCFQSAHQLDLRVRHRIGMASVMSPRILQIFYYQHGSWKNKSTIHYNTLELVKTQSSSEQRAFLSQLLQRLARMIGLNYTLGLNQQTNLNSLTNSSTSF